MICNDKPYHDWLIDCVDRRKWSWTKIALCLIHWVTQDNMTRAELLLKLKRDYKLAVDIRTENQFCDSLSQNGT